MATLRLGLDLGARLIDTAEMYGARPLKRAIQASIENPLAKRILEGKFGAKDTVKIAAKGSAIQFVKT